MSQRDRSSPPTAPRPLLTSTGWALVAILVLGGILRGLYLGEIAGNPDYLSPGVDAGFHQYWANALVTGDWSPPPGCADPETAHRPYVRPPGYPYFLALVYSLFGTNAFAPRVIQMLLGLVNAGLAYGIGRRWFGAAVGLTWAAFMAVYWSFIYFEGELHAPVLVIFFLLAAVYSLGRWMERPRLREAAVGGLMLGLAALALPNVLALVPVAAVALVWIARRARQTRRGLISGAVLSIAAMVAVAPATLRNYLVSGDFVLISGNEGVNLFIGNNASATPHAAGYVPGFGRFGTPYDYPGLVAAVERQVGRPMAYSEVSGYFHKLAVQFMREHPRDFLALTARKALLFWGPVEVANNKDDHYERVFSPILARLPGNFSMVLALGVVGIPLIRSASRPARHLVFLLLVFAFVYFLTFLPFFVAGRYRVPITPILLLFAAVTVCKAAQFIAARRGRPLALTVVGAVAGYAMFSHHFVALEPSLARWHFDRGLAYARLGDYVRAVEHYDQAVAASADWPNIHLAAADALRRLERGDEALIHLNRVIAGNSPFGRDAQCQAARILVEQRRFDAALDLYGAALQSQPDDPALRLERARVLCRAGRAAEAIPELETLATNQPRNAEPLYWLGLALYDAGDQTEGRRRLRAAVELAPALADVIVRMGISLEDSTLPPEKPGP